MSRRMDPMDAWADEQFRREMKRREDEKELRRLSRRRKFFIDPEEREFYEDR